MVHNYYQIGGGEHTVFENEKLLLENKGHDVVAFTRTNHELNKSILKKVFLPITIVFSVKTFFQIRRILKSEHIDIVHCHNTFPLISPSVYYAAWSKKVPVVQTIHNFRLICPAGICFRDGDVCEECVEKMNFRPAIKYRCYRNSNVQTMVVAMMLQIHRSVGTYKRLNYIFLTNFNKEKCLPVLGADESQVFVKPNFSRILANPCRSDEVDQNKFLFVGRLEVNKGILFLLQQWINFNKKLVLHIFGSGPLEETIQQISNENCNIIFHGFKKQQSILMEWRTACALIFPSFLYEGFPMTVIESLSMGVPVLVNDLGNAAKQVKEGINGYHFDVKLQGSFISALKKSQEKIEHLRKTTFQEYIEHYTSDTNYKILKEIYGVLCAKQ